MENKEKKNSLMKLWPLWLILIAITAIVLVNKNGSDVSQMTNHIEGKTELSGKALSLVPSDQYFLPNWFGKKSPDFSVTTIDGDTITLSSLTGKQVMFCFLGNLVSSMPVGKYLILSNYETK